MATDLAHDTHIRFPFYIDTSLMARTQIPRIALTPDHIARLNRDAPQALARRDRRFFIEHALTILEIAGVAALSLTALWIWAAPPLTMVLLLLAATWVGILGEWVKALALGRAIEREMAVKNSDNFVWQVTSALMGKRTTFIWSETEMPGTLRALLTVDFLCIATVTGIVMVWLHSGGHDLAQLWAPTTEVMVLFALTFVLQAAGVAWLIRQHRSGPGECVPLRSTAGLRGLAAIPLMILMIAASSEGRDLRAALSLYNGIMLAFVAPLLWAVLKRRQRETQWLSQRMSSLHTRGNE